ncbi:MAG TPA: cupin domain-containing protein [Thermoplasmata archaeon]|nr:cupin domain-containing protein [Thermoplasmata archaeon]
MYKTKLNRTRVERFNEIGAVNTKIRTLIGGEDGARTTSLHEIAIGKGGSTAMHRHDWEHQLFVEVGHGRLETIDGKITLGPGDVVLVGAGEDHRFLQTGKGPLRFLVVTPL